MTVHSWRFYSGTPLGNQAISIVSCYPTQSHYPDTEPTTPFPILIMCLAKKWQCIGLTRPGFEQIVRIPQSPDAVLIRPSHLVLHTRVMWENWGKWCHSCRHMMIELAKPEIPSRPSPTDHEGIPCHLSHLTGSSFFNFQFYIVIYTETTHISQYQDGYRLVTVHSYDNFIVLPNWETKLPALWHDIPLSHIILTLSHPVLAVS